MKVFRQTALDRNNSEFSVLGQTDRLQIAIMVLPPGGSSGIYGSEHPESDQILYVVAGKADVTVEGEDMTLTAGDTVLIVAGEKHQVRNEGHSVMRSLNFYAPPAY